MIAAAALTGLQIWSGYQQANSIRDTARLNRAINAANARYAEIDAMEAEKLGYTQATRYQTVIDSTVSEQRVGYAAQGVDVSFGTAAEVQKESKLMGFLNQLEIQNVARARARGLKIEASNIRLGGQMSNIQSEINQSAARTTGLFSGLNTAVGYFGSSLAEDAGSDSADFTGSTGYNRRAR